MGYRTTKCKAVNSIWRLFNQGAYNNYRKYLSRSSSLQEAYILKLLKKNSKSLYGLEHSFSKTSSVREYQKNAPLTDYDDYSPYIDEIAEGNSNVLVSEDVLLFEPTSGTSSAEKLIPYTYTLKKEFQKGIAPWVIALHSKYPSLDHGRAYWSISPAICDSVKKHGTIPVGFENDWSYLGLLGKALYSSVAVVPKNLSHTKDTPMFRNATLSSLLLAKDLALISVWSPTFLTLMLKWYQQNFEKILLEIENSSDGSYLQRITELKQIGCRTENLQNIWPGLTVISCWADAASRQEVNVLRRYLPNVTIQGKGLLATEAIVSLPFLEAVDPTLAFTSHFFEFMSNKGDILLAHQLEKDREYTVIVTTGGGLYRYCLGDRILVTRMIGDTPAFRFLGKSTLVSDLYGEKISERCAAGVINSLFKEIDYQFCMIAPDNNEQCSCYTMYVQSEDALSKTLSSRLEELLQKNPNYKYCVNLGQLEPARIFKIETKANDMFEARHLALGKRHGDIKMTSLSKLDDWSGYFRGSYVN